MSTDAYQELIGSHLPALQLLINLGWHYLLPGEALALREGRAKNVVLTGVLESWLHQHNWVRSKGIDLHFDDGAIRQAVNKLVNEPFQSLLLTLGASLTQTVDGDVKSYSLHYIDWQQP
jgi:type I restriction enzyme R subunit